MAITADIAARYGVDETNGLNDGHTYHGAVDHSRKLTLADIKELGGKVTRLRILRERGHYDISYCHATLPDGKVVNVEGVHTYGNWYRIKSELVECAKDWNVHGKSLGLLDEANWSVLS